MDNTLKIERLMGAAVLALREGKTLLYPTDTIWGVGCDAANAAAVEKLYSLKRRDQTKSMLALMDEASFKTLLLSAGEKNGALTEKLRHLALESERPTTIILPAGIGLVENLRRRGLLAHNLLAADGSMGLRVPRHDFLQRLLLRLEHPLVSTSANLSGSPSPRHYDEIEEELKRRVDYCLPNLPEYVSRETSSSRILKVAPNGDIQTIRP
ncbi:MAG: L-threonylcarbamoyladenylate synthase [Bacteroidales bacterium]|nr:L-threonylcarbamoyladenylate synthase [Bacteroidales bacterium]